MAFFEFSAVKTRYYHHGRLHVEGGVLPDAITAYRTYGEPKNPCIVFPTCYGGRLDSQASFVGPNKIIDPEKYFVVTFALFSNGELSLKYTPYNGPYFPKVSYEDNIRAQHKVLEHLGIQKVHLVIGFSMGGQQAYYWAVMYPDVVERFVSLSTVSLACASEPLHLHSFIDGPRSALLASVDYQEGHYTSPPQRGIRALARAYCPWAYGQTFFREKKYLMNGQFPDLNSFMREHWEAGMLLWDANDLVTLFHTWEMGDVSKMCDHGGLAKCLAGITAKGLIMPCKTDLYFTPEDSEYEVACMPNTAKLAVIPSVWGHIAGNGSNPDDFEFMKAEIQKFLEEA
ncbi:hypothetical protein NP233_g4010 [Leucocoprinus birnbaumii]|uniref:AB hydrolase-1 domain-containing protein n=1 Tax=Leucocoprinus birnbaumii TaxID=56174 RepID=A0AAD5YXJ3_9AGAR|nr:hypothetical protein NP233_g4010 [Leucocoprinus birnbaumii]